MFHSEGGKSSSIIFAQSLYAEEIIVPPDSRVRKNVSRSTSFATASWMMYLDSRPLYCERSQVSIQKDSMRTISFCSSPIEPDTSMMKIMTAFDCGKGCVRHERKRLSSRTGTMNGRVGSYVPVMTWRRSA